MTTQRKRAARGEASAFVEVAARYEGGDCLLWPFSLNRKGYGKLGANGEAHRAVCEKAHGPAPTTKHESAHSCGNRPCVSGAHLSWKTRADNHADKLVHGTHRRGERTPTAKLTAEQVTAIRLDERLHHHIAADYAVARTTVTKIKLRSRWSWL